MFTLQEIRTYLTHKAKNITDKKTKSSFKILVRDTEARCIRVRYETSTKPPYDKQSSIIQLVCHYTYKSYLGVECVLRCCQATCTTRVTTHGGGTHDFAPDTGSGTTYNGRITTRAHVKLCFCKNVQKG